KDFLCWNLPREDLAEETLLSHRPSLRAEQAVSATRQRTQVGDGAQRLAALRRIDGDVVVSQAAHPGGKAPVPDRFQFTTDEAHLVSVALRVGLCLQPVAPVATDGVIAREAEALRGGSRSRRVAEDVHADQPRIGCKRLR